MECLKIQVLVIIRTALIRNNDLQSNECSLLAASDSRNECEQIPHWRRAILVRL